MIVIFFIFKKRFFIPPARKKRFHPNFTAMKIKEITPQHKHFEPLCRILTEWIYGQPDYINYLQVKWSLIEHYNHGKALHRKKRKRHPLPKIFIVTHKAKLIGFCRLVPHVVMEKKHLGPWLAQMHILPSYRNCGYGKSLLEQVCTVAKKLNYEQLYLKTEDQESFYQNLDWQSFDQHQEDGLNYTLMKKEL